MILSSYWLCSDYFLDLCQGCFLAPELRARNWISERCFRRLEGWQQRRAEERWLKLYVSYFFLLIFVMFWFLITKFEPTLYARAGTCFLSSAYLSENRRRFPSSLKFFCGVQDFLKKVFLSGRQNTPVQNFLEIIFKYWWPFSRINPVYVDSRIIICDLKIYYLTFKQLC